MRSAELKIAPRGWLRRSRVRWLMLAICLDVYYLPLCASAHPARSLRTEAAASSHALSPACPAAASWLSSSTSKPN